MTHALAKHRTSKSFAELPEGLGGSAQRADRYKAAAADADPGAHWESIQKMPPALSPPTLSPRSHTNGPFVVSPGFQAPSGPPRLLIDPFASRMADMVSRSSANMARGDDLQPRDFVQAVSWKITTNGLMCSISGGYTRMFHSCARCSGLVCKHMPHDEQLATGKADSGESCRVPSASTYVLPCSVQRACG